MNVRKLFQEQRVEVLEQRGDALNLCLNSLLNATARLKPGEVLRVVPESYGAAFLGYDLVLRDAQGREVGTVVRPDLFIDAVVTLRDVEGWRAVHVRPPWWQFWRREHWELFAPAGWFHTPGQDKDEPTVAETWLNEPPHLKLSEMSEPEYRLARMHLRRADDDQWWDMGVWRLHNVTDFSRTIIQIPDVPDLYLGLAGEWLLDFQDDASAIYFPDATMLPGELHVQEKGGLMRGFLSQPTPAQGVRIAETLMSYPAGVLAKLSEKLP